MAISWAAEPMTGTIRNVVKNYIEGGALKAISGYPD
jgi:hypothetical protein